MLKGNKATLDLFNNDELIKFKNIFKKSLNNDELSDIQRNEMEEMIKYIEIKTKNVETKDDCIENNF